jgi:hypothetical protein
MRALDLVEVEEVSGGGWIVAAVAIAGGFILGGPMGGALAITTTLAATGAKNLEHLQKHKEIPTFGDMIN